MLRIFLASTAAVCLALAAGSAQANSTCVEGVCQERLTADQVLIQADKLVAERRFDEAKPLLAALDSAGQKKMETSFLIGFVAAETGQIDEAISRFRSVLNDHPSQTRVRLELARAMMIKGNNGAADHHFRLAGQDKNLPTEINQLIKTSRSILRDQRNWSFGLDVGIAPDTNINNGTGAETVDVNFGGLYIPLSLDANARQRSGIGQSLATSGRVRLGLASNAKMLIEGNTQVSNYKGKAADDFAVQLGVGPEFNLSGNTTLSLQATGAQRWYGGKRATLGLGGRATLQHEFSTQQRVAVSLDARRNDSSLSADYDGWQFGGYASYERVIARSMIASLGVSVRRDSFASKGHSNTDFGANAGIAGELPLGITASLSGGISRAIFDAPLAFFSNEARADWRYDGRLQLGLRSIRLLGFSPSVTYSYNRNASTLDLYSSDRHRVKFGLARYF